MRPLAGPPDEGSTRGALITATPYAALLPRQAGRAYLKAGARCACMPAARGPLVLWAEDNPQDQILIRAALEGLPRPPQVVFRDDGLLLLEALRRTDPALVVLDLKMPRLGGLETLRRIRADPSVAGVGVSVFSAGDHPEETAACQALGALEVVRKPVDFREFTAAVRALLSKAG